MVLWSHTTGSGGSSIPCEGIFGVYYEFEMVEMSPRLWILMQDILN